MGHAVLRAAAAAALLALSACADRPQLTAPDPGALAAPPSLAPAAAAGSQTQALNERLARRLAIALRDAGFRAEVNQALRSSRLREGKVYLQAFLEADGGRHRRRLAALAAEADAAVAGDLGNAAPIEIYLPVEDHRRRWKGDERVLVATAEADIDAPVAFDVRGKRQLLDAARPPATPVIALVRAELAFDAGTPTGIPSGAICDFCVDNPGGAGTGTATTGPVPGLYMTTARFNSTFEGWLKGAPEFEVHILGQDGSTSAMKTYQCAGESAATPYRFNMDSKTWSGSVLLFSQTQLDAYKAAHPGQAVRVLVVEDDDTPCVVKSDSVRLSTLFTQIRNAYGVWTGGRDTVISFSRSFRRAESLFHLLKAIWSFFQTQDEIVGNAIEDVVAREYWTGANWIVKGDNNVTNGAIRLEMR
jgi:hypothetical protein